MAFDVAAAGGKDVMRHFDRSAFAVAFSGVKLRATLFQASKVCTTNSLSGIVLYPALDLGGPVLPQAQATLQTWFGYNLTPDTSLQKIAALVGPPRSGKGTIGRV